MEFVNKPSIIAPCGMNCGICMAYLRERNKCPGCRGPDINKPVTRVRCKIKNCEVFQKGPVKKGPAKFCFSCENFPCKNLEHLDRRYRTRYTMSMIENLELIKKSGIRKFFGNEKIKWTCPECGGIICVHTACCDNCGRKKGSE
jgi:hypothetical protein